MKSGTTKICAFAAAWLTPSVGSAQLSEQCAWTSSPVESASKDVIATPVVADLGADGVPDVVFVTFRSSTDEASRGRDGILRVVSGDDCDELYSVAGVGVVTCVDGATMDLNERGNVGFLNPGAGAAVADIDGDGAPEIVCIAEGPASNQIRRLVAFEHDGSFKWCSEPSLTTLGQFGVSVAFADLDHDGSPEIIVANKVFNADGTLRWDAGEDATQKLSSTAADMDPAPGLEVVTGKEVYLSDGTVLWDRAGFTGRTFPAVADFDLDGLPEVVTVRPGEVYLLDGQTGATRCVAAIPVDVDTCSQHDSPGGGPPTLADVDGDGVPEIGVAGTTRYTMFAFDGSAGPDCLTVLWSQPIVDCSSGFTGSTLFDLEGDCKLEVLYNGEFSLFVFQASNGLPHPDFPELHNTSRTLHEYPVLADVDADGEVELVVASNVKLPDPTNGIRILHDPTEAWAPARAIYNQHAYHVTNVNDDATIPTVEVNSWEADNTFRVQPFPAATGTSYCTAGTNSDGEQAAMGIGGSTSLSANDLELVATGVSAASRFGLFVFGDAQAQVPFQDGFLCVDLGGAFHRLNPILVYDNQDVVTRAVDFTVFPASVITASSAWNFQFWYRDFGQTNLSDALSLCFTP